MVFQTSNFAFGKSVVYFLHAYSTGAAAINRMRKAWRCILWSGGWREFGGYGYSGRIQNDACVYELANDWVCLSGRSLFWCGSSMLAGTWDGMACCTIERFVDVGTMYRLLR